jgi:drug/metabolite transporter (DMT)-like permease
MRVHESIAARVSARAWVTFAAVSVLWGIPYLFIKIAVGELSPGFVAWGRIAIGAAVLLPFAWRMGALRGLRRHLWPVLAYAACEIAVPFVLIALGERYVASSLASILIATMPLIVAVLALRYAPDERPTPGRLAGLIVGLAGVVALLGIDVAGHSGELFGAVCILVATVGYATAPIIINRRLSDQHPLGPVTASLVVATVALAPLAIVTRPHSVPSGGVIASVIVLGVGCTALGLVLFFVLITEAGPSRASVITYINPIVAVALGVTLLDERLGAGAVAGLLLILAGSWLATDGRLPPGLAAVLIRLGLRRAPPTPARPETPGAPRPSA